MRYAKRIIAFLVLSAILLCMPLFSVSAAGSLDDFFGMPPTSSEFYPPAGPNSIVVDLMTSAGFPRRYVFPESIESINISSDGSTCLIQFLVNSSNDCVYEYYGADFSGITKHYASTPSTGWFEGIINVGYTITGLVTNGSTIQLSNSVNAVTVIKPFPDAAISEEKKTQGMISQLISDIKDWFSNLIESMGNFFTDLGNKIGGFFTDLANKIGDFFTKLWNKIWWGNEEGESEYQPPDVGSKFDEVITSLNDWLSQLKGFSDTVDSQGDEVAGYISTGSDFATKFLTYAPAPILIFLTFGIVFVVVRKVVGR